MIDSCREAGERWRVMLDAEKSPYHERAAAATENNEDDRKPKTRRPRRKRAPVGGFDSNPFRGQLASTCSAPSRGSIGDRRSSVLERGGGCRRIMATNGSKFPLVGDVIYVER